MKLCGRSLKPKIQTETLPLPPTACHRRPDRSRAQPLEDGSRPPIWFALDESRPLAFFAGIATHWTGVRKVKEGEVSSAVVGFLTTEPNALVGRYHPKAMPVMLRTREELELWMTAPAPEALALQRPLPDDALVVVARGQKQDGAVALV